MAAPILSRAQPLVRRFSEFLDDDAGAGVIVSRIRTLLEAGELRLTVSVDDLRRYDEKLAANLLVHPLQYLPALEQAYREIVRTLRVDVPGDDEESELRRYKVALTGSFGANHVSPRGLLSTLVGQVVAVEGIVTRISLVRPKLEKSVHYCPATNRVLVREYRDGVGEANFENVFGAPSAYLTRDDDGNELETEFGKCEYTDSQRVVLQEMPERAPAGQLPRSTDVLAEGDLVDACKPGDRVRIVGVFRALGGLSTAQGSGVFKTVVMATSILPVRDRATGTVRITEGDTRNIRALSRRGDVFQLLASSVAPSICGHATIKRAMLLMLLGGNEKNLDNGAHLRGDVNLLLIGDPSTAKSQLLRFVMHIAPLAVSTTGRGSSGVGLTAAVTTDPDTGERNLEAGAMVLADRGVVCIDEFDKMSEEDRVAIHEVMEQQTVTIAKAGIHASLNARCSVFAAGNPVYGSYDTRRTAYENSALPDSLLSRFDLVFTVLDLMDESVDRRIAEHVLRAHQYRRPGHENEVITATDDTNDEDELIVGTATDDGTSRVYDRAVRKLYSGGMGGGGVRASKVVTVEFLRKYIHFAKTRFHPVLSGAAAELIAQKYRSLRADYLNTSHKVLPITARCLETLIRLATALAKCRLSTEVSEDDAQEAFKILTYAINNQRAESSGGRKRNAQAADDGAGDEAAAAPGRDGAAAPVRRERRLAAPTASDSAAVSGDVAPASHAASQQSAPPVEADEAVVRQVMSIVDGVFLRKEMCTMDEMERAIPDELRGALFNSALQQLQAREKIFIHGSNVFRI